MRARNRRLPYVQLVDAVKQRAAPDQRKTVEEYLGYGWRVAAMKPIPGTRFDVVTMFTDAGGGTGIVIFPDGQYEQGRPGEASISWKYSKARLHLPNVPDWRG